jgi:hypothetical protein
MSIKTSHGKKSLLVDVHRWRLAWWLAFLLLGCVGWQNVSQSNVAIAADNSVTVQVNASANDVTEVNGSLDSTSANMWLGTGGSSTTSFSGLRFTSVAIPAGATISSAYLQVYSAQSQWISYSFAIGADASGNSGAFTSTSRPSQRTQTTNTVAHNDNVNWVANTWYSLDEMKSVVQEIVSRPDWQSGNSLSVIIRGTATGAYARKFIRSFDGAAATAPRLIVNYVNTGTTVPTATLSVSPPSIVAGQSSTLSWTTANADSVSIDQGIGSVATSGSLAVNPSATTTYTLTATNSAGTATAATTLTVGAPPPLPTATLGASPGGIILGGTATLSWTTTNASSVTIDHGVGSVAPTGSVGVSPAATTTYTLTAANLTGSVTSQATVTVTIPPPTVTFTLAPTTITSGASSTLSWTTTNATTVTIDQNIGAVSVSGSRNVAPTATTTYTLTASNSGGSTVATATLTVTPPLPTVTLTLSPVQIVAGQSSTLTWTTTGADTVSIDQGIGPVGISGSRVVSPAASTTYTLTATNVSGSSVKTATLTVGPPGGTITTQISSSIDDVNELNGTLTTNGTTLWLGNGGSTTTSYTGLRFSAVAIPAGSTINSALLQVYSNQSQWISLAFSIAAEASGNSPGFTTASKPSQRAQTVNKIAHDDNVNWAANTWYSLDEMKSVVQEVIGRSDWQSGNSISIIMKGTGSGAFARKFVRSFEGTPANAPRLVITYTTVGGPPPLPTATVTVSPTTVPLGASALLTWSTTNATAISIDQGIGTVAASGSITVTPAATTTYTVSATNATGLGTASATLTVGPPLPTVSIGVAPGTIVSGNSATLSWNTSNATSVSIDQGIGPVSASGSITVGPATTTTYTINASNAQGSVTRSTTLTVNPLPPATTYFAVNAGFTDVVPHQVVRTNSDRLYLFVGKQPFTSVVSVYWTANAGLPSSGSDFGGSSQTTLAAIPISISPVYDGANTVHVLANLQNGSLVDVPFDVVSNSFRTAKTIAVAGATVTGDYIGTSGVSGMFDMSGTLQIAYWVTGDSIVHAAYSYNSATDTLTQTSAPMTVDTSGSAVHPSLAVSPLDNSVTIAWVSHATTPKRILARVRDASGNFGSVQTVSNTSVDVWTSPNSGIDIDQGPSMVIKADGTKHVTYIENFDSTGDYGSIHYVKYTGGSWIDQELVTTYSHDPSLATNAAGDLYIIGHGHPKDHAVACHSEDDMCTRKQNADGSWGDSTLFATHPAGESFDSSVSVKWSVVGWNRPDVIEFLFFKTPYTAPIVFYGRIQ